MTASCNAPTNWGKYGSEKGYYQDLLTRNGIPWSATDDVKTLKHKWQTRPPKPKK